MSKFVWAVTLVGVASINRACAGRCSRICSTDIYHVAVNRDHCLLQTASNFKIAEADYANASLVTTRHFQTASSVNIDEADDANASLVTKKHLQDPVSHAKKAAKSGAKKAVDYSREAIEGFRGSAAKETGVTNNAAGDLARFLTALLSNGIIIVTCVSFFMLLRHRYSDVYEYPLTHNLCPDIQVEEGWFDWARRSLNVSIDDVQDHAGLDMAMLLEFNNLGMRIMAIIGIPMITIMGPMHFFFGGHAAGNDRLSYFSFGNVEMGSWLHWIHCFLVWGVVFTVQVCVYRAMDMFMVQRHRWLQQLPEVRANTILVEGIPEERQSDAALKAYFERIFGPHKIKSAKCVKICPVLTAAVEKKATLIMNLDMAKFIESQLKSKGLNVEAISEENAVEEVEKGIATTDEEIKRERQKVLELADQLGGVNANVGFVEFYDRADAEIAATANYSTDIYTWKVATPPPPKTINWHHLKKGTEAKSALTLLAYVLVAVLYFLYLPLVVWITELAEHINMGALQWLWSSLAPYMGLQFMVAFLPTFIILIIRLCFPLADSAQAQLMLQYWYFIFQLVFVLLVTAIGSNIFNFTAAFFTRPLFVVRILGETMPLATHFYMNFVLVQCTGHFIALTRWVVLLKYIVLTRFFEPEQAKELCEPEDQDYYGIGSRSARFTIKMAIGIVFGTLSPPLCLLTFTNFAVGRLVFGYLLCFAETRKSDLGGAFWVYQLMHMFWGNMIYCIMMTGVLLHRASTRVPGLIAGASLIYVVWSYLRFQTRYKWERLPIYEVVTEKGFSRVAHGTFEQPEFVDSDRHYVRQRLSRSLS